MTGKRGFPTWVRTWFWLEFLAVLAVLAAFVLGGCAQSVRGAEFEFTTPEEDTERFMLWEETVRLTDEQEQIMKDALTPLPAPCCSENSAYTCCCPCNLARTWWGLSKHLIAEQGASVEEVRETVEEWFERINPDGFTGNICGTGGCGRAFHKNGCGGMNPVKVSV